VEPTSAAAEEDYETDPGASVPEVRASLLSTVRDRCIECGVPLAADQRYCLECGERNGDPRLPIMDRATMARPAVAVAPKSSRVHLTPNATLVAGIATLLLAMGVGVLIGRGGDGSSKSSTPQIIRVPAAAAAGTAAAAMPTADATQSTKKKAAKKKAAKGQTIKVEGTTGKVRIPKSVVKVGETKGSGPGYDKKSHKFTGEFFGQ